jgi:hypothetical protein
MSILRLEAAENSKIDSRYVEYVDLEVTNLGSEGFDFLVLVYAPYGPIFRGLHHVSPGSPVFIPQIVTAYNPFSFLVITNINTYSYTALTMRAYNYGTNVAIFTQEDAIRNN